VVFMPGVQEMYPQTDKRQFDFGYLDKILDGAHRPGHFNGVAQIVSRLFDIVQPDMAFFGSKDYQQLMIIRELVKQLQYPIEIVACPIIRESDGLAMSSRNALLSTDEREAAKVIPQLLLKAREMKKQNKEVNEIVAYVNAQLGKNKIYKPDYFVICDAGTLKEVNSFREAEDHIALIACFVGKIRLIDNMVI
jgi:pantoate--beta-alanine ligase